MIKKIIFFQILVLSLCSFKPVENYNAAKKVVISGRVLNFNPQKKDIDLHIFRFPQDRELITKKLDSLGGFTFCFYTHFPIETEIVYKTDLTVLAHPGDTVFVEFDGKQNYAEVVKTVKYTGSAAKLNNDIAALKKMLYTDYVSLNKTESTTAIMKFDFPDYKLYLDTMQLGFDNFMVKYSKEVSPCNEAREWGKFYLKQNIYEAMVNYFFNHQFEDKSKPADYIIPVSFYSRLLEVSPINYSTFLNSKDLSRYIEKYWHFYAESNLVADESYKQKKSKKGYIGTSVVINDSVMLAGLIKYTPDKLLRQLLFTYKISMDFDALEINSYAKNQKLISQIITEPYLKQLLTEKYISAKEKLANPKIASDAILKKLENSSAKKLMDSIMYSNKGKVIYIDCWGENCGPCLAEMPNSKKLMEQMKDKDVSFVYVCLDSREKQWKALIAKFQLGGQHYFLDEAQSKEWRKVFNITGIPYYFLIDKNGTIVENGSFVRPNVTKEKIENLLK